jgi:exodeoxyribonuclease VII large subunit
VGELNRLIRYALSLTFPDEVWVAGQIASINRHGPSGHVYFQLVDADAASDAAAPDATISVVLYRQHKEFVNRVIKRSGSGTGMRMDDGVRIRIRGSLDYAPRQGRLQLRMTSIDPTYTVGVLAAERDRVLAALAADGLLEANRQRPFPLLPTRVGLVTSAGSAAHADFIDELSSSGFGWDVRLAHSKVQGPGAAEELVAALRAVAATGVDIVAIVRGGGARTDLMAFDDERLARTIAALHVPVVTGIGHEIDTSVADVVAAGAFKTPTACAAALVERARRSAERAEGAWAAIRERAPRVVELRQRALDATAHRLAGAARVGISGQQHRLDGAARDLRRVAAATLGGAERRLETLGWRVAAVDPQRLLARGWSITHTEDGRVVRDPADVEPGRALVTTVAGGTVRSRVERVEEES